MCKALDAGVMAPAFGVQNGQTPVREELLKMLELRAFPEPRLPEMDRRLAMPVFW